MTDRNSLYAAVLKVNHAGGSGSCFYLKRHNLFVTNYHVIEGFHTVALQDNDRRAWRAHVVLANPARDIALLAAEGDFSTLPELTLATEEPLIGDKIRVAGYPFGMPFTLTEGSISSPDQLMDGSHYIQTDAAVNPGNSGGPMLNLRNEVIAITVSKLTDADNMGFGIPVDALRPMLERTGELDATTYRVQCPGCDEFIAGEEEYCPSCGVRLPEGVFRERGLTDLAQFCEKAIAAIGVDPVLARIGQESWRFHKGSSEIRLFVYEDSYLFCTSPINILPKRDLEPVLTYLLSADVAPYKLGLEENQIYIAYRVHLTDIFSDEAPRIGRELTGLALKADELDDYLHENYGCDFSEYARREEQN